MQCVLTVARVWCVSLRFNDLDNIGFTGRHYSGFIMLGIQVFNRPGDYHFWSSECVSFNYRWLTEELQIDPEEITFIEDVWAGGGNLGPSIEYFVGGLELGNMVFMQYAALHRTTTHRTHASNSRLRYDPLTVPRCVVLPAVRPAMRAVCLSGIRHFPMAAESRCRFR